MAVQEQLEGRYSAARKSLMWLKRRNSSVTKEIRGKSSSKNMNRSMCGQKIKKVTQMAVGGTESDARLQVSSSLSSQTG